VEILSMDRRQLMRFEDALHRSQAHPRRLCQQPASPVCGFARWRPHGQIDDLLNRRSRQRRLSRFACLVARQPGDASASWLNAVEGFFAKLTGRRLKRGVFRSVDDLKAAIDRFIAETNSDPKPFVWTANPKRVLAAVKRGKQALESVH
jgi:hypothetical protein